MPVPGSIISGGVGVGGGGGGGGFHLRHFIDS